MGSYFGRVTILELSNMFMMIFQKITRMFAAADHTATQLLLMIIISIGRAYDKHTVAFDRDMDQL